MTLFITPESIPVHCDRATATQYSEKPTRPKPFHLFDRMVEFRSSVTLIWLSRRTEIDASSCPDLISLIYTHGTSHFIHLRHPKKTSPILILTFDAILLGICKSTGTAPSAFYQTDERSPFLFPLVRAFPKAFQSSIRLSSLGTAGACCGAVGKLSCP